MTAVFRLTVFFALITSVFAGGTLDALVNAAEGYAVAIQATNRHRPEHYDTIRIGCKDDFVCCGEDNYCDALRASAPELIHVANCLETRPDRMYEMDG